MFSSSITTFLLFLVVSTIVYANAAPALDATTLLNNGQEAQQLNALFQTMKSSDPCAGFSFLFVFSIIPFV
jgi:hypothetical protein